MKVSGSRDAGTPKRYLSSRCMSAEAGVCFFASFDGGL